MNPTPVGKNCTVYDSTISYDMRPARSNSCSRNIIQEPLQHTDAITETNRLQSINRYLPAVSRLHDIMAKYGKSVNYNMVSTAGVFPNKIFTFNAICGEIVTYGCGSSSDEAINDAANNFLDKLASIAELDNYFLNSTKSSCLESNVTFIQSNNYIGKLQELCITLAWNLPKYEYFLDIDNEHKKNFYTVVCSAGPFKSTGVRRSKQTAKNHAAYLTINQINSSQYKTNKTNTSNARSEKTMDSVYRFSKSEDENDAKNITMDHIYHVNSINISMPINYIGKLQEMCVARGWELPKYEYHQEYDNKNKNCLFYATCSIGPYRSIGAGITKKIAKNQTAQIVFNQINMDQDKTNGTSTSNASSEKSIDSVHDLKINKVINDIANMTLDQNYHINSNETNITINYIGKLQEMCVARGWELPKYEYHQEYDNKNKNCLFYATCSIGPYRSIGAGITKKIAKNQTAQIVFNQINMDQDKTNGTSTSNASSEKSIDSVHDLRINKVINDTANMTLDQNYYINSNETKMPINYIGKLQEICVACGRELPKYEYHQEYDNINKKYLYSVICSVGPYKSTGLADAKQVAKKQAAQLVLNQINMNQQKTSTPSRNFTHETADNSMGDMITPTNIDLCNIFKLTNLYSNQLLSSKNECVQKLKKCNSLDELNMSAFDFLTKLANEEVFGTTYIQYQKDSYEVYMSLEITTLTPTPVLVCLSTGKTEEEAQNAAAKCALKYIKRILI